MKIPWIVAEGALVAGLALFSMAMVRDHQATDSPTFDETYHLLAGAEYVLDGTFAANLEHPPLMKDLAGFAMASASGGLRSPRTFQPLDASPTGRFLPFLYGNQLPAHEMVAIGRRPFPYLLALLVGATWLITRRLFGPPAALLAAALIALEPNFVAHAGVIHTDVGAALTATVLVGLAELASRKGGVVWWLTTGMALGVALATKFSAVLLVPVLIALAYLRPEEQSEATFQSQGDTRYPTRSRRLGGAVLAIGTGFVLLLCIYAWNLRQMTNDQARTAVRSFCEIRDIPGGLADRLDLLSTISAPAGHYVAGLASVGQLSTAGRGANFFRGVASEKSSLSYFPAAFALKSTPSFIALTLVLFLAGGRILTERRTLVLLVPAAILGFAAVTSHFNIGVRHILPIYPFLAIAGAGILANRSSPRLFAALALLLGFGSAVSLVRSHPFEMSYFNLLADRTGGGSRWLSDSNVDWGQDLMRLGHFLRERGWEDSTTVVAYGGLATNYFVRNARLLTPGEPIRPGRYAVGATIEAIGGPFVTNIEGPAAGAQVEELVRLLHAKGRPVARVGSITIWELPSPLSETLPSGPEPTGRSG